MSGSKYVKLCLMVDDPQETVIENIVANEWKDFIIVRVSGNLNTEALSELVPMLQGLSPDDKKMVIIPDGLDIQIYGVEVESDDSP